METLATAVGIQAGCEALGLSRSSFYAARARVPTPRAPAPPPRTLNAEEKAQVRQTLNSERFADQSPREIFGTLLDEGTYLCSVPTMYRILRENQEIQERRDQLRHPAYVKPELCATGPNQIWTWDITALPGPMKWACFYLYVLLDLFSRFVVGWLVAEQQSGQLAQQLIAESCTRQEIQPDQLRVHSDRGGPMTAKPLIALFADLGIGPSLSRPHTPNDNPFSEAQFKTVKYHPTFPDRFGSSADARAWGQPFFHWYNYEHHHTALGLLTPAVVHTGQAPMFFQNRRRVLQAAYALHPERFVKGVPQPPTFPTEVWINPPAPPQTGGLIFPIDTNIPNLVSKTY